MFYKGVRPLINAYSIGEGKRGREENLTRGGMKDQKRGEGMDDMGLEKKDILKAYKMVNQFIEKLDDESLKKWVDGEARIVLQDVPKPMKKASPSRYADLIEALRNCQSDEEAMAYLIKGRYKKEVLQEIAGVLKAKVTDQATNKILMQQIVGAIRRH